MLWWFGLMRYEDGLYITASACKYHGWAGQYRIIFQALNFSLSVMDVSHPGPWTASPQTIF